MSAGGGGHDDLLARARARAEAPAVPAAWGYRILLEEGEFFDGRWRGETTDPDNNDKAGNPRRIYLLWDEAGASCFSRNYTSLAREIDRAQPTIGCTIAIYRGGDYVGQQGTGYSFGVETDPNDDPLPETEGADDDGVPFLCPGGSDIRSASSVAAAIV